MIDVSRRLSLAVNHPLSEMPNLASVSSISRACSNAFPSDFERQSSCRLIVNLRPMLLAAEDASEKVVSHSTSMTCSWACIVA